MPEFTCKECGKKYKREFYYKKHLKEKHGIDDDEVVDKKEVKKDDEDDGNENGTTGSSTPTRGTGSVRS